MPRSVTTARVLLAPYLVAVGLIVFLPAPEAGKVTGLVRVLADLVAAWGVPREPAAVAIEFAANIVLFVPFGLLVALAWPRLSPWLVIGAGCLTSISIELVQLTLPTRFPTVSDVIANTTGAAIGYALVAWWRLRRLRATGR
ncbi:VanZ family protein [Agromyces soli]